jgi:hypothetical protein
MYTDRIVLIFINIIQVSTIKHQRSRTGGSAGPRRDSDASCLGFHHSSFKFQVSSFMRFQYSVLWGEKTTTLLCVVTAVRGADPSTSYYAVHGFRSSFNVQRESHKQSPRRVVARSIFDAMTYEN